MDDPGQLSEYGKILVIIVIGVIMVCATIFLATLISPKKPNPIKVLTYECGEHTIGSSWTQFNPRFYVVALIFLLFDVELIFIFPWSVVFGQTEYLTADARWGWFTLLEMGLFIGILVLGLVFVWKKGDLEWSKPTVVLPQANVNIPASAYDRLNQTVYKVRDFREPVVQPATDPQPERTTTATKAVFKPRFRKPEQP